MMSPALQRIRDDLFQMASGARCPDQKVLDAYVVLGFVEHTDGMWGLTEAGDCVLEDWYVDERIRLAAGEENEA